MFILDGMWQLQRSLSQENATLWIIADQLFGEMARFSQDQRHGIPACRPRKRQAVDLIVMERNAKSCDVW
jgi:hypothetical protein